MTEALRNELALVLASLHEQPPLVLGITGTATQQLVADGLLATGARPMLTATLGESPALVTEADALLVNLGSLNSDAREAALPTARAATADAKPWVLDPVAIGVAPVRTLLARELLALRPTAVRGNASEVLSLDRGVCIDQTGRGSDSTIGPDAAVDSAREIAAAHGCVVAVSGSVDAIIDGEVVVRVASGHPLLARVSGTGCLLGALTAACLGVAARAESARVSRLGSVVAATALLTVASELAAGAGVGPGTFRVALLDALYTVSPDEVATSVRLTWA